MWDNPCLVVLSTISRYRFIPVSERCSNSRRVMWCWLLTLRRLQRHNVRNGVTSASIVFWSIHFSYGRLSTYHLKLMHILWLRHGRNKKRTFWGTFRTVILLLSSYPSRENLRQFSSCYISRYRFIPTLERCSNDQRVKVKYNLDCWHSGICNATTREMRSPRLVWRRISSQ